jgi:hypothetical protein
MFHWFTRDCSARPNRYFVLEPAMRLCGVIMELGYMLLIRSSCISGQIPSFLEFPPDALR